MYPPWGQSDRPPWTRQACLRRSQSVAQRPRSTNTITTMTSMSTMVPMPMYMTASLLSWQLPAIAKLIPAGRSGYAST